MEINLMRPSIIFRSKVINSYELYHMRYNCKNNILKLLQKLLLHFRHFRYRTSLKPMLYAKSSETFLELLSVSIDVFKNMPDSVFIFQFFRFELMTSKATKLFSHLSFLLSACL